MEYTYGLFVYDNVAALDFIGPSDVFVVSNYLLKKGNVVTVSEKSGPIRCMGGLTVVPEVDFKTSPPLDVLVIPGTEEAALPISNSVLEWIQTQANKAKYIAAVCSGTLILQKAGLLLNRKATTHWLCLDELNKDETVTVLPDMRYVRDENIVTSQGISAGIDMALWLVGQLHSPEHARKVRRFLHYDPAPPYTAEV
jgi:transcriptional regulator GlxA family with amidase domain